MNELNWHEFDRADALADAAATAVRSCIESALADAGQAWVAFPGGRSPQAIFRRLAPAMAGLHGLSITPTDERMGPVTGPLSNAALLRRNFPDANLVPLVTDASRDYRSAGDAADHALAALPWPPALVWLGMGADGHTASIFPGPDYASACQTERRALGVRPDPLPPEAPVARVSLSRHCIRAARRIILTVSGAEKRAVLEQALAAGRESAWPVGQVLHDCPAPVEIFWSSS